MTASQAQEPVDRVEIEVPGGRMPVRLIGSGPPVVLLHGLSANHTEWLSAARHLGHNHRVLVPDLLGRGDSLPEVRARYTLADETDRLALVLDRFGVRSPSLAGHSYGATLALSLASRIKCRRVVLFSPVTPWTRRPNVLAALRWPVVRSAVLPLVGICRRPLTRYILTRRVYGERRPEIKSAVRRYSSPYADPSRARALLEILANWQPAAVGGLRSPAGIPIHVATGARDRRIAPEHAKAFASQLGAEFTLVPGAGHGLTEERPELCARLVSDAGCRWIDE
jgi:pimeloyl-ACP methyl ester carboxylesterase